MADLRTRQPVKLVNNANDTVLLPDSAALADGTANPTTSMLEALGAVFNGTTWDRARSVTNGQDSTGTGIPAAGILGQLDDTATGTVTENQFAPVRISSRRALLVEGVASGTAISVDTELAAAAALSDNFANPTTAPVGAFLMLWDGATWDRAPGDSTNGLTVNTELPAAAALADAAANPTVPGVGGFLMGYNGTTWDRVRTANTGRLQVDVITGGGVDTPTTPTVDLASSSGTAAGSTANLDTSDLGGNTRKLWQVDVTSSVPWKATVGAYENGALVKQYTTLFGKAGDVVSWRPPHRDFASRAFAANAGFDGFRVVATNLDNSQAADLYSAFHYSA